LSRKPDFFYRKKGKVRPGFIRRGGRRIRVGEDLTLSEAKRRVYPQPGKIDTLSDVRELIQVIEKDNIPDDKKRKRLQFQYSLTFREGKVGLPRSDLPEARRMLKNAYQKYVKTKNPCPSSA